MTGTGEGAWLNQLSATDGELVLELGGEVDLFSIADVQGALAALLATGPSKVIFELRGLRFMDSSGISMLVSTAQSVGRIELRYPSATIRRLIELTGLGQMLPITS